MTFTQYFRKIGLVALAIICASPSLDAISLDENGYYDIVIAINEKTAQNANEKYLENLKNGVQDLSDALFESTTGNFSIRSADIVLPEHWQIDADAFATTQHYHNADIRINHEYQAPEVINPTLCGYPGRYIELPYNFFDLPDIGPYGLTGKALLTLWARYRWGVHDEHGYPDDPSFPYFWKKYRLPDQPETDPEDYQVTNCANTEVKGKFQNLNGEICEASEDGLSPPPSDCRFVPDEVNQTATSSLMSFHFINSLTRFCDKDTHNKRAPTRQNLYCRFLSVTEVMEQSMDFKAVKVNHTNIRTPIVYRIVKQVSKPLLYILSDSVFVPPETVINGVAAGLDTIFNDTQNWNVLASTAVYPSEARTDSYDTLYPLNFPWFERDKFVESFRSSFTIGRTGFRTFAAAIQDIGNAIKERRHKAGAIILVVKFGGDYDYFLPAYESEVLATILEQNIQVFALEGRDDYVMEPALQRLTQLSGGSHFSVGTGEDDETNVASIMSAIDATLKAGAVPPSRYRVAHKGTIMYNSDNTGTPIPISVLYGNVKKVSFFLSLLNTAFSSSFAITKGPDSVDQLPSFAETYIWGKSEFSITHHLAEIEQNFDEPTDWEYSYNCGGFECFSMMVVIVELEEAPASPLPGDEIEITISTSVEEDSISDLTVESAASLKGTEFGIYARLEKNGHPINSPDLEVTAHIHFFSDQGSFDGLYPKIVPLVDDGAGSPDFTANDGIFSGSILPISYPSGDQGAYQIFVVAKLRPKASPRSPLPIDQVSIKCGSGYLGCYSETVTEPFVKFADLRRRIVFKGTDSFYPGLLAASSRILDFRMKPHPSFQNGYNLIWTQPKVMTEYGAVRAEEYEIFYTEDFNKLFTTVTDLSKVVGLELPSVVGQERTHMVTIEPGLKYYYVIRAHGQANAPTPVLSNVLFIHAQNNYPDTTPRPTTTFTPAPTTPTTTLPPRSTVTTTLPSVTSTVPTSTDDEITTTRRTTTRTTPTTTSTTPSTTTLPVQTTTKQSKNWIKSTAAIAIFTTFGVVLVAMFAGGFIYYRIIHQ
ncbi:Calcium-activated chloride channel regulator 4 [Orchesella cincta]|uniref:Calcium-activated chloride channel regulator 4 n=1 Tax=Orchesella cincta TaxID=48709 RepID=A0A1D2NMU3_ORCCI|nr:Calcium-activated chloride channel regulator 4 [Orchesella cincta]